MAYSFQTAACDTFLNHSHRRSSITSIHGRNIFIPVLSSLLFVCINRFTLPGRGRKYRLHRYRSFGSGAHSCDVDVHWCIASCLAKPKLSVPISAAWRRRLAVPRICLNGKLCIRAWTASLEVLLHRLAKVAIQLVILPVVALQFWPSHQEKTYDTKHVVEPAKCLEDPTPLPAPQPGPVPILIVRPRLFVPVYLRMLAAEEALEQCNLLVGFSCHPLCSDAGVLVNLDVEQLLEVLIWLFTRCVPSVDITVEVGGPRR
ncbi:hypothetical protein BKA62DRAFT_700907 [Auriculariales sp. MPI-PUGE-AT-0066]|nr:hypothetical protein BKA62DRAFT_700907 [Auriculariales sp. MPI-PUGE-AT-0066]